MSTTFDRLLDAVAWSPLQAPTDLSGVPYATHEGLLGIGDARLRVYQFSTGQRIIDADDFAKFFGVTVAAMSSEDGKASP